MNFVLLQKSIMIKYFLLTILGLLIFTKSLNAQLIGTIKDQNGDLLPFAAVFVKGTTQGTFSNEEGVYLLKLSEGNHTVVYKYVGYKTKEININYKGRKINKNIVLSTNDVLLDAVVINADKEDPAYAIIRNAIKARNTFRNKPNNYKSRLYQKFKLELLDAPETVFGMKIAKTDKDKKELEEMLDTNSNVILVTETISDFFKGDKKEWKEKIISSKISGDKKGYSQLSSLFTKLDFYNNYLSMGKKMISPISSNAFLFYKYELLGTFTDNNGNTINKIKVIPKRKYDPVFSGIIFITDEIWNIYGLDLLTTSKNTNISLLDTIIIKQDFKQLSNKKNDWALLSQYSNFQIGLIGFKAKGYHTRNFISYELNQDFPDNFFNNIKVKIEEQSNKRDSLYWEKIRPIPLGVKERKGYIKMDSIEKVSSSKKYLDSMDRADNKLDIINLLTIYQHNNSYNQSFWSIYSPILNLDFNPVQGFSSGLDFIYKKSWDNMSYIKFKTSFRYGFSDKQVLPKLSISQMLDNKYKFKYKFEIGRSYFQPSDYNLVNRMFNMQVALFDGINYVKLYDKKYANLYLGRRFNHGLESDLTIDFSIRNILKNHSDFSFITDHYYKNNIFNDGNVLKFKNKLNLKFRISFRPGTKYIETPYELKPMYSKYPTFFLNYNKAISINNTYASYDLLKIGLKGYLQTGILGYSTFYIEGGKFLSKSKVDIIDDYYFGGNQFSVMTPGKFKRAFHLLPFYTRSNFKPFFIAKIKQKLKGLIVTKIPLINRLKMEEVFSFNLLQIEGQDPYYEIGAGFDKILGVINLRYSWAFKGKSYFDRGFTVTYNLPITFKRE